MPWRYTTKEPPNTITSPSHWYLPSHLLLSRQQLSNQNIGWQSIRLGVIAMSDGTFLVQPIAFEVERLQQEPKLRQVASLLLLLGVLDR